MGPRVFAIFDFTNKILLNYSGVTMEWEDPQFRSSLVFHDGHARLFRRAPYDRLILGGAVLLVSLLVTGPLGSNWCWNRPKLKPPNA